VSLELPSEAGQHILYVYVSDDSGNVAFDSFTFYTSDVNPTTIQIGHSYIAIFTTSLVTIFLAYRIYKKRK
ncbi:MAG: hypothetical protein ACTSP5_09970, partial [Candidatus Heimdallarchaeota archaeon]